MVALLAMLVFSVVKGDYRISAETVLEGAVQRSVVAESSGYAQLDEAAQEVADRMVWKPAMNRDKKSAVWLSQAIDFSVT